MYILILWSRVFQCMYMYYLLGYRLFGAKDVDKALTEESELESRMSRARNRKKGKSKKDNLSRPIKSLFNKMDPETYEIVSEMISAVGNDNEYEFAVICILFIG